MAASLGGCLSEPLATVRTERLRHLASERVGEDASLLLIEADSTNEAWGRVVRARTEAPLEESESLALLFDQSTRRPVEIVAGGPYAPLNEQVLRDAFALAENSDLAGVHLVWVDPEATAPTLDALCRARGARCEHVVWLAPLERD